MCCITSHLNQEVSQHLIHLMHFEAHQKLFFHDLKVQLLCSSSIQTVWRGSLLCPSGECIDVDLNVIVLQCGH